MNALQQLNSLKGTLNYCLAVLATADLSKNDRKEYEELVTDYKAQIAELEQHVAAFPELFVSTLKNSELKF